jgi:pimeloyl-ACP methyl ester carboxylesterase
MLDMAAGHVFLRQHGFENVVAIGHSGGAALAALYLQQAARPPAQRLAATPGGKPVPLGEADMPLADGLMLMAPHRGQGALLQRVIDPSDAAARTVLRQRFTRCPSIRVESCPGAGHSIELHRGARAYILRQLAFAEECLSALCEEAKVGGPSRRRPGGDQVDPVWVMMR